MALQEKDGTVICPLTIYNNNDLSPSLLKKEWAFFFQLMTSYLTVEGDRDTSRSSFGENETEISCGRHQSVLVRGLGLVLEIAYREKNSM